MIWSGRSKIDKGKADPPMIFTDLEMSVLVMKKEDFHWSVK